MFGKRKRNSLYCIEMSHSEEWLIFFYTRKQKGMIEQRGSRWKSLWVILKK